MSNDIANLIAQKIQKVNREHDEELKRKDCLLQQYRNYIQSAGSYSFDKNVGEVTCTKCKCVLLNRGKYTYEACKFCPKIYCRWTNCMIHREAEYDGPAHDKCHEELKTIPLCEFDACDSRNHGRRYTSHCSYGYNVCCDCEKKYISEETKCNTEYEIHEGPLGNTSCCTDYNFRKIVNLKNKE